MAPVVCTMSISLDGYGTGPNQTEERPFGDIPDEILHRWMIDTPEESPQEIEAIVAAGAFVMGRNMFGPVRGEWTGANRWRWRVAPRSLRDRRDRIGPRPRASGRR